MAKILFYPLFISIFLSLSCNTSYKAASVQYSNYKIQSAVANTSLTSVTKSYGDRVNKLMNAVIGYNETLLERKRPVNPLGYFITDAYLEMAKQKVNDKVDVAFMNPGGVRLPDLPAGAITQGKLFELMPFDNVMVQIKMKGNVLKQYLDTLAASEGIIQSGLTMQVVNKTAQQIIVGGKPIDANAEYIIVHSDYVAMNSGFLKNMNRTTNGYLLRDAIIDYVKHLNSRGRKITVLNIDRVTYVN